MTIQRDGQCILLTGKPRMRVMREGVPAPNSVRAYKESPERVCLQIRSEVRFISASLTAEIARELAADLIAAANEVEGA